MDKGKCPLTKKQAPLPHPHWKNPSYATVEYIQESCETRSSGFVFLNHDLYAYIHSKWKVSEKSVRTLLMKTSPSIHHQMSTAQDEGILKLGSPCMFKWNCSTCFTTYKPGLYIKKNSERFWRFKTQVTDGNSLVPCWIKIINSTSVFRFDVLIVYLVSAYVSVCVCVCGGGGCCKCLQRWTHIRKSQWNCGHTPIMDVHDCRRTFNR